MIVDRIATTCASWLSSLLEGPLGPPGSIFAGETGALWSLAHLPAAETRAHANTCALAIERLVDRIGLETAARSAISMAGMAMTAIRADRTFGFEIAPGLADEFDGYVSDLLLLDETISKFELIDGLAGLGPYLLWRGRETGDTKTLVLLLDALVRRAEPDDFGLTWRSTPAILRGSPMGQRHPAGCVDLGVAHGVGGPLALIAKALILAPNLRARYASPLAAGFASLRQYERRKPGALLSRYGYVAHDGARARCAWCYGDLGLSSTYALGAKALDDVALFEHSKDLLATVAGTAPRDSGIDDPWLCHGSAGAALLLHRLARFHDHSGAAAAALTHTAAAREALEDTMSTPEALASLTYATFLEGPGGAALALHELETTSVSSHGNSWATPLLILEHHEI